LRSHPLPSVTDAFDKLVVPNTISFYQKLAVQSSDDEKLSLHKQQNVSCRGFD